MSGLAEVVPDSRAPLPQQSYTYTVPEELAELVLVGTRVEIPFGKRSLHGVVVGWADATDQTQLKAVSAVLDDTPLLAPHQVELALWIAARYCAPLSEVLRAMVPKGARAGRRKRKSSPRTESQALAEARRSGTREEPPVLTPAQHDAVTRLVTALDARQNLKLLLHGVTGSGKTEVYLSAIDAAIARGKQAIVLVPEIALTPQMIRRFAARFPERLVVLHSALTDAERAREWTRAKNGEADVVVGSRSAIFAPLPDLGIIVIDEEDASAYKQDRLPRYHAVEVALELSGLLSIPAVLGSATPRVESYFRAHTGEMEIAKLDSRINGRALPPIEVVDLREELRSGNLHPLSLSLQKALQETHDAGGQSILYLNRRGTAQIVLCRNCGETLNCSNCSVALVHHAERRACVCHHCGLTVMMPKVCPRCNSEAIRGLGMGTERLQREVEELLPGLRILRMDRDTTVTRDAYFEIYEQFRLGKADCLIGTQMITKGWDLGRVHLVGIVNADTSLHFPDYRSCEVTFSLLTQVAGRAGRGDEPARVILQTYTPDHYAVRFAREHDYLGFARHEIRSRKRLGFPPYSRLITCTFSDETDAKAEAAAAAAVEGLRKALRGPVIDILGPMPAYIHRLRGNYRWQFTLRGEDLSAALSLLPSGKGWSIDVDPAM